MVYEKIKSNVSYEIVDNNINYYVSINLNNLKQDVYFENIKSERYQQVLLTYWNYFIDYLKIHNDVCFIKGTFRNFSNDLFHEYINENIKNMTVEQFIYCEIEEMIMNKFYENECLDLSDIDLTRTVIGFAASRNQDFYSNEYQKIICKYKVISADIRIYSFIWIAILSFILLKLVNLFYKIKIFSTDKPLVFLGDIFLCVITFIIGIWLCIFIKDLFRFIFYKVKYIFLD